MDIEDLNKTQPVIENDSTSTLETNQQEYQKVDLENLSASIIHAKVEVSEDMHIKRHTGNLSLGQAETTHEEEALAIIGKVGEGAMGEILLAKDQDLKRTVAYKKLLHHLADDDQVKNTFLNEIQITAQLEHPNVVPIYNLEVTAQGAIAYSMKLVQGKTLKELVAEARSFYQQGKDIPETHTTYRFLEYFLQVCSAMEYSHKKGVIHRDLKPANIMIGSYHEVYVMDWGIATLIEAIDEKQILGTPRYMSPEQAGGLNQILGPQSDLFSLGLILFELVTLTQAMPNAASTVEMMQNIIKGKRKPIVPYHKHIKIPRELSAIIEKSTQRRRKDRYTNVKDMADDIRRYLRGDAVLAQPDSPSESLVRGLKKHSKATFLGLMGFILLSVCVLSIGAYRYSQDLLEAKLREKQLQWVVKQVNEQSHKIDSHFIYLEGLLRNIGSSVIDRLDYGKAIAGPYYLPQDFIQAKSPAIQRVHSDAYQRLIHPELALTTFPPGANFAEYDQKMKILQPLQALLKESFLESYPQKQGLSAKEKREIVLKHKAPLSWTYFALESGIYMTFPAAIPPENYDPRVRPWYKQGKASRGLKWQNPYIIQTTGIMDLPCTMALYDKNDRFRGVALIDVTIAYLQEHLLPLQLKGVLELSLVNAEGKVIVSSIDKKQQSTQLSSNDVLQLKPFGHQGVLQAIQKHERGYYRDRETRALYIYSPVASQNWTYILKANEEKILENY